MDGRCSSACNHRRLVSEAEKPCNHPAPLVSRVHQANQHQLLWLLGRLGLVNLRAAPSGGQAPSLPFLSPLSQVPSRHLQPATATRPVRLRRRWQDGRQNTGRRPRIARVSQSRRFPTEALPSDHPPRRLLLLAAVLTCRGCPCPAQARPPVGAAHWVCARLGRYALLHPTARCTAAACVPGLLAGWLPSLPASLPAAVLSTRQSCAGLTGGLTK